MILSKEQRKFINYAESIKKDYVDVTNGYDLAESTLVTMFEIYLTANNRRDRVRNAWIISQVKYDYLEHFGLIHLIEDVTEFIELVDEEESLILKKTTNTQMRRHQKRNDFALTEEQWRKVVNHFEGKCAYCGRAEKLTYDHFHPFSKEGDFMEGNVIPCCISCNSSKKNTLFHEWYPNKCFYNKERETKVLNYVESKRQLELF